MQLSERNGVCVRAEKSLFVDAFGIRESHVVVSHAHSDHCRISSSNNYFMTNETFFLSGAKGDSNVSVKGFGEKFFVNGFDVSLHPSGHILGSSQCRVSNSVDAVITSDFKLQESLLLKPAEVLPCDILVMETTFGRKEFSFPPREKVYEDMAFWAKEKISKNSFIVLGGYATGKAQELTKFSNEYLGVAPLVHKKVFEKNTLAEKAGARLGGFIELDHNLNDSSVLIMPPGLVNVFLQEALSMQLGKKVECAIATGWKNFYGLKTFPLSDHADFNQLLKYVEDAKPKQVFTYHGFDEEFAKTIMKRLGVPAKPLRLSGQKTINECFG